MRARLLFRSPDRGRGRSIRRARSGRRWRARCALRQIDRDAADAEWLAAVGLDADGGAASGGATSRSNCKMQNAK